LSDIFISYASADRPRVKPLVEALSKRGWSIWWDRTILPGQKWDQVIGAALDEARCVIVLWSRDSVQSDWVLTEADDARQRGILVPALIDDVKIPLAFRRIQAANLVNWTSASVSAEFDELVRAVEAILSHGTGPSPETPAPTEALALEGLLRLNPAASATSGEPHIEIGPTVSGGLKVEAGEATPTAASAGSRRTPVGTGTAALMLRAFFKQQGWSSYLTGAVVLVALVGSLAQYLANHHRVSEAPAHEPAVAQSVPAAGQKWKNPIDGLTYVWIPPGKFRMGCSPGDDECNDDEKPPREVQIENGFWLGQTEVTQAAWKKIMKDNPSQFQGDQLPVESVDRNQANAYCKAVGGRLPTEKEWEYAARGGTTSARYGELDAVAWYDSNSGGTTHPVGLKQPNAFGLYDMLGNVWEWTADNYDDAGKYKVLRGGSWRNDPRFVRVSFRNRLGPSDRGNFLGFRCVGEFR